MSNYWLDEYKVKVPVVLWTNESVTWTLWTLWKGLECGIPMFQRKAETGKTIFMHEYEGDLVVSIWAVKANGNMKVTKGVITKDGLKVVV